MKVYTAIGITPVVTVFKVAFNRTANCRQLSPDLMVPAGVKVYFK